MILKSVLQARADRGYRWLQEYGLNYGLDVSRLHRPNGRADWDLNVQNDNTCPLALCVAWSNNQVNSRYSQALSRLILSSSAFAGPKLHEFLASHGFEIWPSYPAFLVFRAGSQNDWDNLTVAWRKVVAANPAPVSSAMDD
jgi:hypothetical protein